MSKTLLLIRHAKAEETSFVKPDFNRKLSEKGIKNAHSMATKWRSKHQLPQLLLSSDAKRALQTAQIFAQEWQINNIEQNHAIYNATRFNLLQTICQLNNQYNSIAIFGHNPGLSDLTNYLCGNENYQLPTCGIVEIALEIDDWQFTSAKMGKVTNLDLRT